MKHFIMHKKWNNCLNYWSLGNKRNSNEELWVRFIWKELPLHFLLSCFLGKMCFLAIRNGCHLHLLLIHITHIHGHTQGLWLWSNGPHWGALYIHERCHSLYSWPLKNMNLKCTGSLMQKFFFWLNMYCSTL